MAKKQKTKKVARPAKTDALAERLSTAIAALKEHRKTGRGAGNKVLKEKLAARFKKKEDKILFRIAKMRAERDDWRGRYRALSKSTKQLLRLAGIGPILRNKTEGSSSNAGGGTPAATSETKS